MANPLNLNLLIPFKDNKRVAWKSAVRELEEYRSQLDARIIEIQTSLKSLLGSHFEVSIMTRSDGHSKRCYWRYKSSKQDRGFYRLASEQMKSMLIQLSNVQQLALIELEEEMIAINGNYKLVKNMLDALSQSDKELEELMSLNLSHLTA